MTIRNTILILMLGLLAATLSACAKDPSSELKGQVNTTLTFYGLAVDQDGKPLEGVRIEYDAYAYPKDWTFETRGRPYDVSKVIAVSNAQGQLGFAVTGCFLRLSSATCLGYRNFLELDDSSSDRPGTRSYRLISWGTLNHKSDPNYPAVYVFVKDGAQGVSALPCAGGYSGGPAWHRNMPAWPKEPSLKDVVNTGPKPDPHPHRVEVPNLSADDPHSSELVFYGLAVDQTGTPLPGVEFGVDVEHPLPTAGTWNREGVGKDRFYTFVRVESGPDGRFEVALTGRSLNIRYARRPGYWLFGESSVNMSADCNNLQYLLDRSSGFWYRSDRDHPAVYVLMRPREHEIAALPCRGGYDSADGQTWTLNKPTWPKYPSARYAVRKKAATQP